MRRSIEFVAVACMAAIVTGFGAVAFAEHPTSLDRGNVVFPKAPYSGPANVPSVTPDAGGDTCATATVISSLPYTDSGTTVGFNDDYDEVCPYTGSTSPDVVYTYTPAVDTIVDISVCNSGGDADYDTKIYVYEDVCATPSLACNDDACQAASYSGGSYNSELVGVSLTGGHMYAIVIDGYGGASGTYTISVVEGTQPPTCAAIGDPGFLIGQDVHTPSDSWSAAVSGQASWQTSPFIVAESIDQAADPDWFDVSSINFWGLSLENSAGWAACDPTGMTFDVIFYEDAAGLPGTEICNVQSVAATIAATGVSFSGFELYQFTVAAACNLGSVGTKWVSIQSEPMTGDCAFLWMSASTGDGWSPRDTNDDGVWETDYLFDCSMCINGSTVPVGLASFLVD